MRSGLALRLSRAAALALLLILGVGAGCRHRGAAWAVPAQPVTAGVEIIVIGQPRESRATRLVAGELERVLANAAAAGRTPIIAWLGTDLGRPGPDRAHPCPDPHAVHAGPALTELTRVVHSTGAAVWGLPGPDAWRCGMTGFEARVTPTPYEQPGVAYVLRVSEAGQVALVSSCELDTCTIAPPAEDTLLELVALDFSFWHYPALASDDLTAALLSQQAALLEALAAAPAVPRLLLSPIPVESAGAHGVGGRLQRTGYRYLPEFVQQALTDGLFVGVLGALERDLQVSEDLSNAIHRSARTFVSKPIFEVVSGSAGGPKHTPRTSRGDTLLPDLETEHPGFARVIIEGERVHLRIHARRAGRWRVAGIELPLDPEPLPSLREPPTIQPCHSCDPMRGAADGEVDVPRGPRPP
ncbi:hypothetical protein DB30_00111 [Enhygromyxa salina]|uniref:Uncharacterized protein n=1 Tax=Enhygromyxa salina TaxID=215803 RepID=A0A0C2DIT6_9BACT|nr:hypothetical protein [Enhygromyxa salina]KIG19602.1 hypothetical protein DB30_00111 [Enhygromyxa salina]